MTQFLKSRIGHVDGFEVLVAKHAAETKEWRAHMGRVAVDDKSGVTGIEKHWPYGRPAAHPLVEAAVNENGDADYRIVDDGPTADQILRAKKDALLAAVSIAERSAIGEVVPPGRARMFNMRENDIRQADGARADEMTRGLLKSVAKAVGFGADLNAELEKARPADDTRHLQAQDDRRRRIAEIERVAAQAHHDIEDLTDETVDAWQMPAFPTREK